MTSTPNLYPVHLDPAQRESLEDLTRNGHAPVKKVRNARVLLLSDHHRPGGRRTDEQIAEVLGRHVNTVARVRKLVVAQGERPAPGRKPRRAPPVALEVDGRIDAHLIALCTGPPPEGRARWTMQLLAGELVRQEPVDSISDETARVAPKKTR